MTHETVGSGGDDGLALVDTHRRGGERVLAKCEEDPIEAEHHESVTDQDERLRYPRPVKTMVECRDEVERNEQYRRAPQDDLLLRFGFGLRPGIQPPCDEGGIVAQEIERQYEAT